MALPSSGEITFNQLNSQLRRPATQTIGLRDAEVIALAGTGTGTIAMSNLHGKWAGMKVTCVARDASGNDSPTTVAYNANGNLLGQNGATVGYTKPGKYGGGIYLQFSAAPAAGSGTFIRITDANFVTLFTGYCAPWDGILTFNYYVNTTTGSDQCLNAGAGTVRWVKTA